MRNVPGVFAVLFLMGCGAQTFQNVQLGMSQEQFVQVAGKPDSVIAGHKLDNDLIEVYEYRDDGWWWGDLDEATWFFFNNHKLESWGRPGDHLRYVY